MEVNSGLKHSAACRDILRAALFISGSCAPKNWLRIIQVEIVTSSRFNSRGFDRSRLLSPHLTVIAAPVTVAEPPREDFTTIVVGETNTGTADELPGPTITLTRGAKKQGSALPHTGG